MKVKLFNLSKFIFCVSMIFLLVACNRLTQENFDKVKNEMTRKEVIAILGEPTSSDSVNVVGFSGTASVWKDRNAEIDIQFLNDKVIAKSFSKNK